MKVSSSRFQLDLLHCAKIDRHFISCPLAGAAARSPSEANQAAELFHHAAEQHNALAEYDYGYCLEIGLGVPRDKPLAYAWYRRALADAKDANLHAIAQSGAGALEVQLSQSQFDTARRVLARK